MLQLSRLNLLFCYLKQAVTSFNSAVSTCTIGEQAAFMLSGRDRATMLPIRSMLKSLTKPYQGARGVAENTSSIFTILCRDKEQQIDFLQFFTLDVHNPHGCRSQAEPTRSLSSRYGTRS